MRVKLFINLGYYYGITHFTKSCKTNIDVDSIVSIRNIINRKMQLVNGINIFFEKHQS